MCGICGIIHFDGKPVERNRLSAMTGALVHRGPDDEGFHFFPENSSPVQPAGGLGFRRLSIIDIAGGHQPMKYKNRVIVFNGEIYNFRELKRECESRGHTFATESDTEVLLHLYQEFGGECLKKLNGMFAFVIWDEEKKEIFLARDRIGIKPLYYSYDGQKLIFASEMKSLFLSGEIPLAFDSAALFDFYSYRFVPGPYTVLKNVKKVLPGHFIRIENGRLTEKPYWSLGAGNSYFRDKSPQALQEELLHLLGESVRLQLVSDVPLGAFLSGGVDSSLVAALMVKNSKEKVKTFSIGFEKGTGVDESRYARETAKFLGTEHHEMILTEKDLARTEKILSRMNEPVADPTILPTAILSEFARGEVKVVLTGEGGDELFAGYNRYKAVICAQWIKNLPPIFQPAAASAIKPFYGGACFNALPDVSVNNWFDLNRDFSPELLRSIFGMGENQTMPGYLSAHAKEAARGMHSLNPLDSVLELERQTSLVDRLLMKVDCSSMGQSLEARPPYLDHRVVEFAFRLPQSCKIRFFKGKYILRKAAEKIIPKKICWRRKHGFIVPLEKWVSAQSPDWLGSLLENSFLDSVGLFNKPWVQKRLEKIYNNRSTDDLVMLWPMIVLSCWIKSLKDA